MKNLILLLFFTSILSCTTTPETPIIPENEVNNVEIIFTTTEPISDEIQVTYFDIEKADNISSARKFEYDNDGNPLPMILKFDDYKYKFLDGEAFRNNFNTGELRVQILINGVLLVERFDKGTSTTFATVDISFRIN